MKGMQTGGMGRFLFRRPQSCMVEGKSSQGGPMFKRKTVFVVGASASKEVDLPVGDELKNSIASKVNIGFNDRLYSE